jgi:tetratricopeptide (TPR) repeat protein
MDEEELEARMQRAAMAALDNALDEVVEIYDELDTCELTKPQRGRLIASRAGLAIGRGELQEGVALLRAALELYGSEAPAFVFGNLGFALDKLGDYEDALVAHRRSIALHEADDGATHPLTLRKRGDLAYGLIGLGRLDEAEAILREVVAGFETQPEREPLWYVAAISNLGHFLLRSRGDAPAALECFDRALGLRDLCTLRAANGTVIREGFPPGLEKSLREGLAAALAAHR